MLIATDDAASGAPGRLRRWLRADLADLVDVSGPRGGSASTALGPGGDHDAASFEADLGRLRGRILRRWIVAVAGRYALTALALAVVPAALAAFGLIGWASTLIAAVALFAVALLLRLLRPPSLERVARFLDDRLGLFDVVATALQVERSGEAIDTGPAAPVFIEAAALLRSGVGAWSPRSKLGSREFGAAVGLAALLAVIAVVGAQSGAGSSTKATAIAVPGKAHRKGSRITNVSPPLAPTKAERRRAQKNSSLGPEHRSPLGLYDFGYEGKRPLPKIDSGGAGGLHYAPGSPGSKRQSFAAQAPGEGNEAREKAEEEADNGNARSTSAGEHEQSAEAPETLKSLTGGKAPPSGSVSPVPNSSSNPSRSSGGKTSGGQGAPSSSASGQRSAAGATGKQSGGRPSGSANAGHGTAKLGSGDQGSEGGSAGGALPLRAGFAAVKSSKAATSRGPRDAQGGGGPGRSAGVAGSAFEEASAGSLGYVPPDAGIASGLDPGLYARYQNALTRIQGLRW